MKFRRTGERRYAVVLEVDGEPVRAMDPAPGFDEHFPHDLVHYVVEAELGMIWASLGALHGPRANGHALSAEDAARVVRVVARLDELAPLWHALPVGGELVVTGPSVVPASFA